MLTICAHHSGGNLLHKDKTLKFDVVGERPATKYIQISWTNQKECKNEIANGMARTNRNFRFSNVNEVPHAYVLLFLLKSRAKISDRPSLSLSDEHCRRHLQPPFKGLKDIYRPGRWSRLLNYFYCHVCHTRFVIFFHLPSWFVSSLFIISELTRKNGRRKKSKHYVTSVTIILFKKALSQTSPSFKQIFLRKTRKHWWK